MFTYFSKVSKYTINNRSGIVRRTVIIISIFEIWKEVDSEVDSGRGTIFIIIDF